MPRTPTALIVDDDRTIQRLLADALTREGFSVLVEKDGEWALKTFDSRSVDVVLLDLLLPAMHGFEVARRLRATPRGRQVPLFFISGIYKGAAHQAEAEAKYKIAGFLDKPINLGRLTGMLQAALGPAYPHKEDEQRRRAQLEKKPADKFADSAAREEAAEVESTARRSAMRTIRGDFASKPFPELLAELYRWRATGALLLRRDKVKKIVYFRDGRPFSIKSNLLSECLGRVMVRERMISEAECEQSIKRMQQTKRQQGTVLIEMGCISPHNLSYALSLQLQEKLFDLFSWAAGEYQFNPQADVPSEANTLDMTTAQIIYEGVKRHYSPERVRALVGHIEPMYVHPASDPLLRFQEVGLDDEELSLLRAIDGSKTAARLIALEILPATDVVRFLYAMTCAQMIELRTDAAETEITDRSELPANITKPPPLPAKQVMDSLLPELSGLFGVGVSAEEREVRERLAAQVAAMKKKDYFEVLGVSPKASRDEIRRAYLSLAKEYHPDKHFASSSAEVKNLAAQVYDVITAAHDTLVDDDERDRYLADLAQGVRNEATGDEVGKILAAEGKFQRGEDLLKKQQFADALSAFREAVTLYPDEGEFHAYLGWSLYKSEPGSADRAIEHIENGIRLNPKVDKSYLFLGYIHKAAGRPDRAEKQFEKAIQCNPDCIEAMRELRLLGKTRRK